MRQLPKRDTVCETIALCVDVDPDQIRSSSIADLVSRPFTELQFKTTSLSLSLSVCLSMLYVSAPAVTTAVQEVLERLMPILFTHSCTTCL